MSAANPKKATKKQTVYEEDDEASLDEDTSPDEKIPVKSPFRTKILKFRVEQYDTPADLIADIGKGLVFFSDPASLWSALTSSNDTNEKPIDILPILKYTIENDNYIVKIQDVPIPHGITLLNLRSNTYMQVSELAKNWELFAEAYIKEMCSCLGGSISEEKATEVLKKMLKVYNSHNQWNVEFHAAVPYT